MGGGTKTKSESKQGSGQTWAQPYALDATKNVFSVYDANKDNLSAQAQKANDLVGTFEGNLTKAGSVGNAGQGYFNSVMGGKYLTGNPYIDAMIQATNKDVTNNVNSQFTLGGRYGSGAHTGVLANELSEAENALRYGDYSAERDRMGQAAQGSVAADAARAQAEAAAAQTLLAQQQLAASLPYVGSESLASSLGALFGGGTSTSTSKTSNGIGGVLGGLGGLGQGIGAMGSAGMFASDPRLKENIVKLGAEPDGLGFYEWNYIGSDERDAGVMADEVAELRPWALGPVVDGFMTVNYEAL